MPAKKAPKTYTITEAAKKLRISRQAVHDAITRKQLRAEKGQIVQTVWLIPADALKEYRVSSSHKKRGKKTDVA